MIDLVSPLRIVLLYVICGVAWIYCSDSLLLWLYRNPDPKTLTQIQHYKGTAYILLSGGLLLWLLKKYMSVIRSSEMAYIRIFETSPQPMWIYDRVTLRFLQVNDAALFTYGYSREDFLKLSIHDIRPTEDVPKIPSSQRTSKEGYSQAGIWRHLTKSGKLMYVNIQAYGTQFEGRDAEVVCIWDITDQYHAEQALKEQKGILSTIINSTDDLIWSIDSQKRFLAFNKSFHSVISNLIGRPLQLGDDQPVTEGEEQFLKWQRLYDRCLAGEKVVVLEERNMEDMGQIFTETTFNPVYEDDKVVGAACFARDVTRRKQQQIELKKALERYDTLNLATNDAIWDWDLIEDKVVWNNNVQTLFGYKYLVDEDSHWKEHIHPEDLGKVTDSLAKAIGEKRTHWALEFRFLRSDNTYRHVFARSYILKDEQGNAVRMIGSMQDIQEKKLQEVEIRKLSLVASLTANPVIIADPRGHIEWVNKSFELLWGHYLEDIEGLSAPEVLHGPDTDPEVAKQIVRQIKAGEHCKVEILNYTQWGTAHWVLIDITPIIDKEGKVERLIIIQTDITEKKAFEQQLEERNKDLMEVAYISSHKLRRPVASLLGIIALMDRKDPGNPENIQLISFIEKLTKEMDAMLHVLADKCNYIYLRNRQAEEKQAN